MIQIVHHADPGHRSNMEDASAAAIFEMVAPIRRQFTVVTLCDGVGGAKAGEIASIEGSRNIVALVGAKLQLMHLLNPKCPPAPDVVLTVLQDALTTVNKLILNKGLEDAKYAGMATTAVCAVVVDGLLHIKWVGDSRAYLLHQRALCRLTRDHTRIQDLLEAGEIRAQEARTHPEAHTITQYLGKEEDLRTESQVIRLAPGDVVMETTDGVTDVLDDRQIEQLLVEWEAEGCPFHQWPERLVNHALEAQTQDNASVLLMRVQPEAVAGDPILASTATARYPESHYPVLRRLLRR